MNSIRTKKKTSGKYIHATGLVVNITNLMAIQSWKAPVWIRYLIFILVNFVFPNNKVLIIPCPRLILKQERQNAWPDKANLMQQSSPMRRLPTSSQLLWPWPIWIQSSNHYCVRKSTTLGKFGCCNQKLPSLTNTSRKEWAAVAMSKPRTLPFPPWTASRRTSKSWKSPRWK